jgi:type VI secretion system protein ImpH
MASEDGRENDRLNAALRERLLAHGCAFSFFQAVRLLERGHPGAAPVGHQGPPEEECIRFRAHLSLAFPCSDIAEIRSLPRGDGNQPAFEITATFLGLYGAASPLPSFYTEDLFDDSDESLVPEFLDLFHHRILSLLYRGWEKYRHPIQFVREGSDRLTLKLLALIGLDRAYIDRKHAIPPVRLLAYAGLLLQRPRSASALRGILADYFNEVPVTVETSTGESFEIPLHDRNVLGARNSTLGVDLSLGERVRDPGGAFSVRLGPMGRDDFISFLPPGSNAAAFRQLIETFDQDGLDCRLEVVFRHEEVPRLELSGRTALLGWSSWLGDRPSEDPSVRFLLPANQLGKK